MEQINNNKLLKPLKRFLKDTGRYVEFKQWINSENFKNKYIISWTKYSNDDFAALYAMFSREPYKINQYTNYLTTDVVGINEAQKLFKNFIIKRYGNKIYEEYLKNIDLEFIRRTVYNYNSIIKYKKGIRKVPINGYLFYAFEWAKTKQGHKFWQTINDEWERTYQTLIVELMQKNKTT